MTVGWGSVVQCVGAKDAVAAANKAAGNPPGGAAAPPAVKEETPKRAPGEKVALSLNNLDVIFSEIRNLSIERLGSYLQVCLQTFVVARHSCGTF
jgi:hypothetical protein